MAAWNHRRGWKGSLKATQSDLLPQLDRWPACLLSGTAGVQRELLSLGSSRAQLQRCARCLGQPTQPCGVSP